jgi:hypothetical protein
METTQEINGSKPPDTQLAALDILKMWERGELNDITPDDLLKLRAIQCVSIALGKTTLTGATI